MIKTTRKGVFLGAYIPQYMKDELARRAKATRNGSMSKVLCDILRREISAPGTETTEERYRRKYMGQTQSQRVKGAAAILERLDKKDAE